MTDHEDMMARLENAELMLRANGWNKSADAVARGRLMLISHPDAERLDWLMRKVSGSELRRLGIVTSAGMTRELLDATMHTRGGRMVYTLEGTAGVQEGGNGR